MGTNLETLPGELQAEIAWNMSLIDINRLASVSRGTHQIANRVLYQKDAAEDNTAIQWAARYAITERRGIRVINNSLICGGDVNARHQHEDGFATALHVAAATGKTKTIIHLLKKGAAMGDAQNLGAIFPELNALLNRAFPTQELRNVVKTQPWRPLFAPVLRGDHYTAELLLANGHTTHLTERLSKSVNDPAHADQWTSVNLFHILAMRDQDSFACRMLRSHHEHCKTQMIWSLLTPLHLAVSMGNVDFALELIHQSGPGDLDKCDSFGNSSLHLAVLGISVGDAAQRKKRITIVRLLLSAGANPNLRRITMDQETPLLLLADKVRYDWPVASLHMKEMFRLLLGAGANLNVAATHSGNTVLLILLRVIHGGGNAQGYTSVENWFLYLVQQGADPSLPVQLPNQPLPQSLLALSIFSTGAPRFAGKLTEVGAVICQHELDGIFTRWVISKKWPSNLDVLQMNRSVSQPVINLAFRTAFTTTSVDIERFIEIYNACVFTGDWERLIWDRMARVPSKLPEIPFPFNAQARDGGETFIHRSIRALQPGVGPGIETRVLADVEQFIRRGVPVGARDDDGMTALERLLRFPREYRRTRRVLVAAGSA